MKEYNNKQELIDTINDRYQKYIDEFSEITEQQKDLRIDGVAKTPSENLSYQLGWINLLLQWDKDELAGKEVKTPSPEYKWNNLGGLYQSFYHKYGQYSLSEQIKMLEITVKELIVWINSLTDQQLFEPRQRKWATTKAVWSLWKWIHINTIAPFTNFRTEIRKWKKLVLK